MIGATRTFLDLSLHSAVRHWAQYQPGRVAIITEEATFTYSAFQTLVRMYCLQIHRLGFGRQTPIGILVRSKANFLAAVCALLSEGHIPVFVNLSLEPHITRKMFSDASCEAVVCDSERMCPSGLAEGTLQPILIDTVASVGHSTDHAELVDRYADDTWGIVYSSGTTGVPKGIVRSDLSILNELVGWCFELPITRASIGLIGRPLYYTGGLMLSAATLLAGGSLILPQEWSAGTYVSLASQYPVDFAFLVPEQIRELLNARRDTPDSWPRPSKIMTMGAPITPTTKQQVVETLAADYIESWGNSEGLGTITSPADVQLRPASIGRPFLSDRMWIVDDNGNPLPIGKIGRLAGRADSTLSEYCHRDDLNQQLIRGRMVISEDLGYMDEHHYFYLVGRVSERFVQDGMPVFTTDIEEIARLVPGVVDIAVAGVTNAAGGEDLAALVVASGGVDADVPRLLKSINGALDKHQRLGGIYLVPALPRNASGKVDLNVVKRKVLEQRDQLSTPD
jgi:acyl-coenzyme A synthetase/AMP-(fatty) acid ligase